MPGEDYQSWSITAADNGTADSAINWAEGQPRSSVNNSSRAQMAAHAKNRNLLNGSIVTGGTASAQTFTSGVGYTAVPTGLQVLLKIGPTLTSVDGTATTLNMDGIGDVGIKNQRDEVVEKGLVAGTYAHFIYNGTNWIWLEAELLTIINNTTNVVISNVVIDSTVSGPVALVDFTDLDTTQFSHYHIIATNIVPETDRVVINISLSTDNGVTFPINVPTTFYNSLQFFQSQGRVFGGGTFFVKQTSSFGHFPISWDLDKDVPKFPYIFLMDLFHFQPDKSPSAAWTTQGYISGTEYVELNDGRGTVEGIMGANAIRIWLSAGNFVSANFTLYGYN